MELTIENSCRICMLSACTLVSIFEEHDGVSISEYITEISGVKIDKSDSLSKKICDDCEAKAFELYAFRQLCIDSDETVRFNLLLADPGEGSNDDQEIIKDETLKNVVEMEEYFIEDRVEDESVDQSFEQDPHDDYEELFVNDEDTQEDHQILTVESIEDENSYDMELERKNTVVIERVDSKLSLANSVVFEDGDDLTLKMREAHYAKEQQKKHKCPHCDKFFMFPSKGLPPSLSMPSMLLTFPFILLVNRHVQAVHKNQMSPKKFIKKNHRCNICNKAFVSQFKVRRHMIVHDTELKMGLQKNWSRNYFLCESCNKKFHTQTTFDRHMLICDLLQKSLIERPLNHEYICVICAQIFASHDDMIDHMRLHPQSDHMCVMCPDMNFPLNDMIRHGKYHDENVVYRCCVCQKAYPNGEEIVTHMLRHKEYKPFSCNECGKSFFDKYKLRQHLNTHDPNVPKNFICEFCQRAFAAQDYLNCHIRRKHSDSKPHLCTFCTKSFAFLHDLNLHLSVHTGGFNAYIAQCTDFNPNFR